VVLGLLTGLVVAVFDYTTNMTLWSFFSDYFAHNPFVIVIGVFAALLFSGFVLTKSSLPMSSGTDEVVDAYNFERGRMNLRSFPGKMQRN